MLTGIMNKFIGLKLELWRKKYWQSWCKLLHCYHCRTSEHVFKFLWLLYINYICLHCCDLFF